jgi:hypothetical protein
MFMRATLGFEQDIMREGSLSSPAVLTVSEADLENSRQHALTSRKRRIRAPEASLQRHKRVPIGDIPPGNRIRSVPGRGPADERCRWLAERESD